LRDCGSRQGDDKRAVELMSTAADLYASIDKHPATPTEVLLSCERQADLLSELGDPTAALKEYEQSLRTDRNRFRSILGMARAATQTGDTVKAREASGWRALGSRVWMKSPAARSTWLPSRAIASPFAPKSSRRTAPTSQNTSFVATRPYRGCGGAYPW